MPFLSLSVSFSLFLSLTSIVSPFFLSVFRGGPSGWWVGCAKEELSIIPYDIVLHNVIYHYITLHYILLKRIGHKGSLLRGEPVLCQAWSHLLVMHHVFSM